MNNHHKIISLHGTPSLKYGGILYKKIFSWGRNFFGQKFYEVILNGWTNDQIMPRWRRSFKNDKCILQISKVVSCSVSLALTLTWRTDILFGKLRPETRG